MKYAPTKCLVDHQRHVFLLVGETEKYEHVLTFDTKGVKISKVPPGVFTEINYPVDRATEKFREWAAQYGATKEARQALAIQEDSP